MARRDARPETRPAPHFEIGLVYRSPDGGINCLGTVDDVTMVRTVFERLIQSANLSAARGTDPLAVRTSFAQSRVLRHYLEQI